MPEKKSSYKIIWDFLGSRDLSVFIFVAAITYSLFAYIFSLVVPASWFDLFQTLLPMIVLYSAFFINLLICEIKWLPVAIRRCRRPKPPDSTEELERFWNITVVSGQWPEVVGAYGNTPLQKYLRRRGYKIQWSGASGQGSEENVSRLTSHVSPVLYAYRGRFSPLGNLLFHLSFFFLLAGIILGLLYRVEGKAYVIEGSVFDGKKESYETLKASPFAVLPEVFFTLDAVKPKFWGDRLLFTDLRADVTTKEGSRESAWLSKQAKIGGAGVSLNGLGYALKYIVKDKEGRELKSGISRVNVFFPGTEDALIIPGYPHRFLVAYYPDAKVTGETVSNVSMNRNNPVIGLRVNRGRLPVFSGILREGEEAEFENLKISFPEVRYWGDFKILKNPGFYMIWVAFGMMIIGLAWRFLFCRREVVVFSDNSGMTFYCRSEFFPGLFEKRMREIVEKTGTGNL